jgi:hypothetical protein
LLPLLHHLLRSIILRVLLESRRCLLEHLLALLDLRLGLLDACRRLRESRGDLLILPHLLLFLILPKLIRETLCGFDEILLGLPLPGSTLSGAEGLVRLRAGLLTLSLYRWRGL